MKDNNIKKRYLKALENLESTSDTNEKSVILEIIDIQDEFDQYNKELIKAKIDLGIFILIELLVTSLGLVLLNYDTNSIEQNISKYIYSTMVLGLGVIPVPKIIDEYRKKKLDINASANKSLEEHEDFILKLKEKEKVNVKKR